MTDASTLYPVGYGVAAPSALNKPSVLLCDNIDPQTHDYVSLFTTIDPIDAQVIIAMKIVRNSGPAVVNDGNRMRDIRKITTGIESEIESRVKIALSRLISNGDIKYKGIIFETIDRGNQTVQAKVQYVNLRSFSASLRTVNISTTPIGISAT